MSLHPHLRFVGWQTQGLCGISSPGESRHSEETLFESLSHLPAAEVKLLEIFLGLSVQIGLL